MKLYLDLDETLVYAFPTDLGPERRPVNVTSKGVISLPETFEIFMRPDLELLRGIPFSIMSNGVEEYVRPIADLLKKEGLRIREIIPRERLEASAQPVTMEQAFLIDNLDPDQEVALVKQQLLPNGTYLRVDAWDVIPEQPPTEMERFVMPISNLPRRRVQLGLIRTPGSRSLAQRLDEALGGAA